MESNAYFSTARIWDDGIIDPMDTRKVLALESLPAQCTDEGRGLLFLDNDACGFETRPDEHFMQAFQTLLIDIKDQTATIN
jgi:hypothetical protein